MKSYKVSTKDLSGEDEEDIVDLFIRLGWMSAPSETENGICFDKVGDDLLYFWKLTVPEKDHSLFQLLEQKQLLEVCKY